MITTFIGFSALAKCLKNFSEFHSKKVCLKLLPRLVTKFNKYRFVYLVYFSKLTENAGTSLELFATHEQTIFNDSQSYTHDV